MAPWTLQERMTLHVLFGHHRLDFYGPTWWALHRDITHTERTERTCREDYKYSHGKERTKMYPTRILKPYANYDAEERAAYDKAFQDVIDSAQRQGIVLPGSDKSQDEEEEDDHEVEDDEDEEDEEDEDEVEVEDEDIEMEDAEDEYATAQEDASDSDDSSQDDATANEDAAAHEDEAVDKFKMPDFPDDTLWDQRNPDLLAESEFAVTGSSRAVLSSAIGAREMSRKRANVSAVPATPASNAYPLPAHLETVAKLNPTITAGLASTGPVIVADSAANTPDFTATGSGEPQKRGRGRLTKQGLGTENAPSGIVEESKRDHGRPDKRFTRRPSGEYHVDRMSDLSKSSEGELAKETRVNTTRNRKSLSDSSESLETMKAPGTTLKKSLRKQVAFEQAPSKKPKAQAQLNFDRPSKSSTRDQDWIEKQVKLATPEVNLPLVQATQAAPTAEVLPARGEKYDIWCRENLDRILFADPFNMFPNRIIVPGSRRTAPEEPLSGDDRVTNFFFDMFDGNLTKKLILSTLKKMEESDKPGRRLKKVYRTLVDEAKEISVDPRYTLSKVFDSEESPFSNFRLATTAFGQDLKMLHMSDVDYTGVGNQQLVAFAKTKHRHLTADDIDFISPDDPVFKRGGRVHKLWIRQQDCPILGDCKKYNTTDVCIDVMICQEAHCPRCSKDDKIGSQLKSVTTLPRVHSRHIAPGDKFVAPLLKISRAHEKDYKDEFIVDVSIGVQSVELWDGTMQEVVVCDRANCPGCFEASGGIVQRPNAD
jgi:hypothetical protein